MRRSNRNLGLGSSCEREVRTEHSVQETSSVVVRSHTINITILLPQLLPLQIPLNPTNPSLPHQPKRPILPPRPREILHRIIRLYPHQQRSLLIQYIYPFSRACDNIPISRHLEPVWHPLLREIYGALVTDVCAVTADVEGIDRAFASGVEGGALRADGGGDGAGDGAGIGDVDCAFVG